MVSVKVIDQVGFGDGHVGRSLGLIWAFYGFI